jgi:dolichyl-phosphate beta-glucosyltransferase
MRNLRSQPIAPDHRRFSVGDATRTVGDHPPTLQCLTPIVVILPVHNAQATLPSTLRKLQQYLYRHPHVTALFIDDGSTDRSRDILTQGIHQAKTPQLQMLSYQPHAGKGYAVRLGMRSALAQSTYPQCEYLCLLDGDLAYSLDHLDDLMIALQRSGIVIGNRQTAIRTRKSLWICRLIDRLTLQLAQHWLGTTYADPQAGLKGFRASAAQTVFQRQAIAGFGFDLELLYIAEKHHLTIAEIPAQPSEPHQHQATQVKIIWHHLGILRDALRIRLRDLTGRYK